MGGAIYAAAGTLNLVNDDLENNQAIAGGALNLAGEITTITNTNISNNSATGNGSAIDQFSIKNHAAVLAIQNSTFFNNQSSGGAASIVDESLAGSSTSNVTDGGSISLRRERQGVQPLPRTSATCPLPCLLQRSRRWETTSPVMAPVPDRHGRSAEHACRTVSPRTSANRQWSIR